jgi:heme/copper-type cytochrome/quinol oxidase subunit 3
MDAIYLDVAQTLILIFGGVVVFYAMRAYRRTKSQAMLLLAVGFACVAIGALVAGVIYNLNTGDLSTPITVQAYSQVVGFLVIVYSLAKAKS